MRNLAAARNPHSLGSELIKQRWSPRAFSPQACAAKSWQPVPKPRAGAFQQQRTALGLPSHHPAEDKAITQGCEHTLGVKPGLGETPRPGAGVSPYRSLPSPKTATPTQSLLRYGAAVGYLSVDATSRGVFVHQMAGFDPQKQSSFLKPPRVGDHSASLSAIGQSGNFARGRCASADGPRERKPLAGYMGGHWERRVLPPKVTAIS